jgi:hypothetical protein
MGTDSVHRVSHVGVCVSSSLTGDCSASGDIPRPAPGAGWPLLHPVVAARFRSFRETNSQYGSHMTLTDETTDLPEPQPNEVPESTAPVEVPEPAFEDTPERA